KALGIGINSHAKSKNSISIGNRANVYENAENAISIGNSTIAQGKDSIVIGKNSLSEGKNTISIGNKAKAYESAENAIAIGNNAVARGKDSVVIGKDSFSEGKKAVSIGYLAKTYKNAENAVSIGNNTGTSGKDSIVMGINGTINEGAENSILIAKTGSISSKDSFAIGNNVNVSTNAQNSFLLGRELVSNARNTMLIGYKNKAENNAEEALIIGTDSRTTKNKAVIIGIKSTINGESSTAIGNEIVGTKENSVYLGYKTKDANSSVSKEMNEYSNDMIGTTVLTFKAGKPLGIFSVGSVGYERRIQNVAAGWINQDSTDAINGSQLYAVAKVLDDLSNIAVKYDNKEKTKITLAGNDGTTIDKVKTGKVSATSKEAINGSQLYDVKQKVDKNTQDIEKNRNAIASNKTQIDVNKENIATNTKDIVTNREGINKNKESIAKNMTEIVSNTAKISAIENELKNKGSVKSETLKLSGNDKRLFGNEDLTIELKENSIEEKHLNENLRNKIQNMLTKESIKEISDKVEKNTKEIKEIKEELKTTNEKIEKNTEKIQKLDDIAVKYDSTAKDKITLGGTTHNPVTITNLANGTKDSDAVNYNQLKDIVNGEIQAGETRGVSGDKIHKEFLKVREEAKEMSKQLSGGIATTMAMASIPQVGDNKLFSIGAGAAYYNKQGGFALGISGTEPSNTFIYKLSAGIDTQKIFGVSAGFNINFVDNTKKASVVNNNKAYVYDNKLADKITKLEKENEAIKNENKSMKDRITALENKIGQSVSSFKEKLYIIDQFINNKYIPTKIQIEKLKAIVKEINERYTDRIIDITGHTDTTASERYNLELGLKRANKVSDLLISLGLKNPQNIRKVSSYGFNNKVNSNLSSNRRVEITIK
ncbi:OmpA family protein, partial [Caviibacter abscessus]|uniref:OmpA family protein n=1 Tax=Caviibacter abscessus TaxID=1766719 RepID=UPI00082A64A0